MLGGLLVLGLPLALRTIAHVVGLDDARADEIGFALAFFLGPRDPHHPGATAEEKVVSAGTISVAGPARTSSKRRPSSVGCRFSSTVRAPNADARAT